ncbi:NADH-quinone oxidoreductase subunit N [Flavihumibacter petaseus]|uniref:NADH-quinone oxidoreductase subunit N n=1 Tax=Flavihumibacter petaseus NBRC 106054 TaxID=1220578 RepID=A0A0E9MTM4_9BACT|nr:NADH-quinone oxidoreductase subunit N [Flavihumibacter petaseus]GAO41117.1 NADH--quinone oxidoreductase subunit N [Flavihumibacter petaseus NBRC 106054]
MSELQFQAILPFVLLAASSIVVILLIAFRQRHTVIQVTGFLMMCLVVFTMWQVRTVLPRALPPLFLVDGFAAIFTGMIVFSVLVVGLFSFVYFEEREENPREYYILLFLATLGGAVLTISKHFLSFFLALELLSVGLYALVGYLRYRNNAIEAGMKYLILAALSSAFLLFGMALVYMETGSMDFAFIVQRLAATRPANSVLFIMGISIMLVAVGFKLALVPFHLWAADVYQGAPAPVTAFIATSSKIAVFAVLLRLSQQIGLQQFPVFTTIFSIVAIASMITGNFLALQQQNVKRLLAYSSIAHFGYLLVAFLPGNTAGVEATIFYLSSYSITLLSALGVITVMSTRERDAEDIADYRGLFWRYPALAAVLSIALFSLAGIPLTAGFLAKFFVLAAGVQANLWLPVTVLVLASVVSLYFYLRIISTLFADAPAAEERKHTLHPFFHFATYATLWVMLFLLCWLGVFPGMFLAVVRDFLLLR